MPWRIVLMHASYCLAEGTDGISRREALPHQLRALPSRAPLRQRHQGWMENVQYLACAEDEAL
jgi:hypothetical protein